MTKPKLNRHDWIAAAFKALNEGGPEAVKVEPVARALQATKGSFYWHFKNLAELKEAMLLHWKERATREIIRELEILEPGKERLSALIKIASQPFDELPGAPSELAIRDWARHDDMVAMCLQEVDMHRIAYIRQEMVEGDPERDEKAHLLYAAHLGLTLLSFTTGKIGGRERQMLLEWLSD